MTEDQLALLADEISTPPVGNKPSKLQLSDAEAAYARHHVFLLYNANEQNAAAAAEVIKVSKVTVGDIVGEKNKRPGLHVKGKLIENYLKVTHEEFRRDAEEFYRTHSGAEIINVPLRRYQNLEEALIMAERLGPVPDVVKSEMRQRAQQKKDDAAVKRWLDLVLAEVGMLEESPQRTVERKAKSKRDTIEAIETTTPDLDIMAVPGAPRPAKKSKKKGSK